MTIEVTRKYYKSPIPLNKDDCDDKISHTYAVKLENPYFVRPHDWYHVAIRWKDFTDMDFSSNTVKSPIVVSGVFYDDADAITHTGPLTSFTVTKDESVSKDSIKSFQEYLSSQDTDFWNQVDTFGASLKAANPSWSDEAIAAHKTGYCLRTYLENHMGTGKLDPIEPSQAQTSTERKMIFGQLKNTETPEFTIDDIGISTQEDILDSGDFSPSRYPFPSDPTTDPKIAIFKGRFMPGINEKVYLGYLYWTIRQAPEFSFGDKEDAYATEETSETESGTEVSSTTEDYKKKVYEEIWKLMTENLHKETALTKEVLDSQSYVKVHIRWSNSRKSYVRGGSICVVINGEYRWAGRWNRWGGWKYVKTKEDRSFWFDESGTFREVLLKWYKNYAEWWNTVKHNPALTAADKKYLDPNDPNTLFESKADESKKNKDKGGTISTENGDFLVITSGEGFNYELEFVVASGVTARPLYRMSVLDEVVVSYQANIKYFEYNPSFSR